MKKNKKMFTMVGSLALVGAVAVGATLAYLSDNTKELTNTFTIGKNIDVQLVESDKDDEDNLTEYVATTDLSDQQDYGELYVGESYLKNPMVQLKDSNDAYLYIYVSGVDSLINTDIEQTNTEGKKDVSILYNGSEGFNTSNWTKVAEVDGTTTLNNDKLDGIYVYIEDGNPAMKSGDFTTSPLFDHIRINEHVKGFKDGASLSDIVLKAAAVQANENTEYQNQAIGLLKTSTSVDGQ